MKTVEPALQNYLNTEKNFISCDLFELVLANGNTYYYADSDCDISYNNHIYKHDALLIKRQQIKLQGQVTVDTLGVTIYTDGDHSADMIESQPVLKVAHSGLLDGAKMHLRRAFFNVMDGQIPAASVIGVVGLFGGDVEIKSSGGIKLELTIKSNAQGLNKEFPIRKYYPEGCYSTTGGIVISTGETNDTCLIAPFVPRKEVLM